MVLPADVDNFFPHVLFVLCMAQSIKPNEPGSYGKDKNYSYVIKRNRKKIMPEVLETFSPTYFKEVACQDEDYEERKEQCMAASMYIEELVQLTLLQQQEMNKLRKELVSQSLDKLDRRYATYSGLLLFGSIAAIYCFLKRG